MDVASGPRPESAGAPVLVLTGTRGSGKSTLSAALARRGDFAVISGLTTRTARADDAPGGYQYVTTDVLAELRGERKLLLWTTYDGYEYAVTTQALQSVLNRGQVPILTCTPESAHRIYDILRPRNLRCVGWFLDAPNSVLDERLSVRGDGSGSRLLNQRVLDREHAVRPLEVLDTHRPVETLVEVIVSSVWPEEAALSAETP